MFETYMLRYHLNLLRIFGLGSNPIMHFRYINNDDFIAVGCMCADKYTADYLDDVRKYVKDPYVMKFVNFYFEFVDKWLNCNAYEKIIRDLKLTHTHKDIVIREMQMYQESHSSCIFVKMLKPNANLQKEIVGAILSDTFYHDILKGAFMKLPKLRALEDDLADWDTGLDIAEEQHHPIIYVEDHGNNIHVAHSSEIDLFKKTTVVSYTQ